jgi:pyridoxamine 5'-phosphate oxidase
LLKGYDEKGFIFYTNYESQKGNDIATNPKAALLFFWPLLERQIRINGIVEKAEPELSDQYFLSRPDKSQIAAACSPQSEPVADRAALEQLFQQTEQQFAQDGPKRPDTWGAYRLVPTRFEFWQGRPNRLHDRLVFTPNPDSPSQWTRTRLAP